MTKNKRRISIIAMLIFIFTLIPTKFIYAVGNKDMDILAKTNITKEDAKEWAYMENATNKFVDLADLYWDLYKDHGNINPAIAFVHAALESEFGNFDIAFNEDFKNPGSIDFKGESLRLNRDTEPYKFNTWKDGVTAHLDHLALLAGVKGYPKKSNETTDINHSKELYGKSSKLSEVLKKWISDDEYVDFVNRAYNDLCEFAKVRRKPKMNLESVVVKGTELTLRGWGIHGTGTTYVNTYLDGRHIGQTLVNIERKDVARAFPQYRNSNLSGFEQKFNINDFSKGTKELKVEVFANDGSSMIHKTKINVEKKDPKMNLEKFWVEGNTLKIKGWVTKLLQ